VARVQNDFHKAKQLKQQAETLAAEFNMDELQEEIFKAEMSKDSEKEVKLQKQIDKLLSEHRVLVKKLDLQKAVQERQYDRAVRIKKQIARDHFFSSEFQTDQHSVRCWSRPGKSSRATTSSSTVDAEQWVEGKKKALMKQYVEPLLKQEEEAVAKEDYEQAMRHKKEAGMAMKEVEHRNRAPSTTGCMIEPEGNLRVRWDTFQVLALFYVALLVPLRVGFALELVLFSFEWWVELLVDVYFIADIFLNCTTVPWILHCT
jgi:hypothetical protein